MRVSDSSKTPSSRPISARAAISSRLTAPSFLPRAISLVIPWDSQTSGSVIQMRIGQHAADEARQPAPVDGAQRLGDDLGEHEDAECEHGREDADRAAPEHGRRLRARARSADRVGDGVEAQDRCERAVDVRLHHLEALRHVGVGLVQRADVGRRDAEQDGLQDRAQKADADRDRDVDDQQRHRPGAGGDGLGLATSAAACAESEEGDDAEGGESRGKAHGQQIRRGESSDYSFPPPPGPPARRLNARFARTSRAACAPAQSACGHHPGTR